MEVPRITVKELKEKLDRGEAVALLDVRNPTAWVNSDVRLPGAVRIAMDDLDSRAEDFDHAMTVVAYCT
jgi:rhodanese-related sulfurtransferase